MVGLGGQEGGLGGRDDLKEDHRPQSGSPPLLTCPVSSLVSGHASGYDLRRPLAVKHATDDIVSSAECSSDDEDLEECDTSHAGGLGQFAFACFLRALTHLHLKASRPHG